MSFKLFDFGEQCLVNPPHSCDPSCGDPCATYTEIEAEEEEIIALREALAERLARYRGMRTKMNLLHDPLVRRFPLEITTAIFRFCLPKQHHEIQPQVQAPAVGEDNASMLFTLGAVCTTWRQIVWSTARFWSHIYIPIFLPCSIRITTAFIKQWIGRTAHTPLSIVVCDQGQHDHGTLASELISLAEVVNDTAERWECLDLRLHPSISSMFRGRLRPSNLRQLRVLDRCVNKTSDGQLHHSNVIGGLKPKPTHVEIEFVHLRALDIGWDNLTHFTARYLHVDDCFQLLRLAPKLARCKFEFAQNPPPSPPVPIVHHNLRELTILHPYGPGITTGFLNKLTLPQLEVLSVEVLQVLLPADSIISFIARSSCQLRTLEIRASLEEGSLMSLLKLVPSLQHLSLLPKRNLPYPTQNLFRLIADTSDVLYMSDLQARPIHQTLLPELQTLRYATATPEECEEIWDIIPDLFGLDGDDKADGYDAPRRPLNILSVSFYHPSNGSDPLSRNPGYISKATISRVKRLIDAGVDIDILFLQEEMEEPEDFVATSMVYHESTARENRDFRLISESLDS